MFLEDKTFWGLFSHLVMHTYLDECLLQTGQREGWSSNNQNLTHVKYLLHVNFGAYAHDAFGA